MTTKNQDLQVVAEGYIKAVEEQILKLQENGELDLPRDYSASNALRSAYLILQETTDMSNKPALDVCSKTSIANALMNMVTQGLNPAKNQGYFIVYAGKLTFQRSYFGSEALAKRIDLDIADIVAEPVYAGDTVEYSIVHGKKVIAKHLQTLDSVDAGKVKAAYAMTINHAGEITRTTMMTFEEIKAAWKQGKSKPFDDNGELKKSSVHAKFTGEMARRTAINRLCKDIINSSSDKNLLKKAMDRADRENVEMAVEAEIAENANQTPVDIEGEVVDAEFTDKNQRGPQGSPPVGANETTPEPSQDIEKPPRPPAEKSEPKKSTATPTKGKETPEPQEKPVSEKEGESEDPFHEEMSVKEREDADIEEKRAFLEDAAKNGYLEEAAKNMKKYVEKLSPKVQEAIREIYRELKAQKADQQPAREF